MCSHKEIRAAPHSLSLSLLGISISGNCLCVKNKAWFWIFIQLGLQFARQGAVSYHRSISPNRRKILYFRIFRSRPAKHPLAERYYETTTYHATIKQHKEIHHSNPFHYFSPGSNHPETRWSPHHEEVVLGCTYSVENALPVGQTKKGILLFISFTLSLQCARCFRILMPHSILF